MGISPMLAMATTAVETGPQRRFWFVHGCRNSMAAATASTTLFQTRLRKGQVADLTEPTAEVRPGSALVCIARPASATRELDQ